MEKQTSGFTGMGEKRSVESDRSALRLHPLYTVVAELDSDPSGVLYSAKYEAEVQKVLVKSVALGIAVDKEALADPPPESLPLLDQITGSDGRQLVVLEFPKASSLKRVLDRQGNMTVRPAVSVIVKVLSALSYLHERGRVFGTLSSKVVFLSRVSGGKLKLQLAYFGLKTDGRSMNHLEYRPSESGEAGRMPNFADDLFAAGVLLYEMLFGLMPFPAAERGSASGTEIGEVLYLPTVFENRHPTEAAVLRRALHERPAHRFSTADDMIDALRGQVVRESTVAKMASFSARADAPRSSIPTVPSPPRDSLLSETLSSDGDVTRPYSIPAIEASRSLRSDAAARPRNSVTRLIAFAAIAMLVPIAVWLLLGDRIVPPDPNTEKKIDSASSPALLNPTLLDKGAMEQKASAVPRNGAAADLNSPADTKEAAKKKADSDHDGTRASAAREQSEGSVSHRQGKRKKKTDQPEQNGPADNLSSNPFPLKNNPFPTGE